ncbi:MAG: DUF2079 domain-containing protein [Aphanocapsa sp. GSE-SYN-MK-11-07L]|jgi:uncharacterized membrane protein|nr:DUF2079 domain-containing protein [Aphanocapsa sp. GSE-SYN-MK-11-07L]
MIKPTHPIHQATLIRNLQKHPVFLAVGISALFMFVSSVLRHELFNSSGDLAFFDQGVYLISQGKPPIASVLGFHVLADHAAWILYFIALLYKVYPSVYWLFAVQAIALALGAIPTYLLAVQAGLKEHLATAMVAVYLLYPVVYNSALADFHPDVIALPALLTAILAARANRTVWFCLSIILVLGCKAVLALTVFGLGVWLLLFEKRRVYGAIAIASGIAWFLIANKLIIPFFGTEAALVNRHLYRYSYFGSSFADTLNIFLAKPQVVLANLFSPLNFEYLALLLAPVVWGLRPRYMAPLIAAIPCLALNLLADHASQKNVILHYSLPIIPFLMVALIASLAAGKAWIQSRRAIILWSLVGFAALGKVWFFGSNYLNHLDNLSATREAIALVNPTDSVFTTDIIAPHLTHRQTIGYNYQKVQAENGFSKFHYVLINTRHPGWAADPQVYKDLVNDLSQQPRVRLQYKKDDVYLFEQSSS